jgi:hypothetical protein
VGGGGGGVREGDGEATEKEAEEAGIRRLSVGAIIGGFLGARRARGQIARRDAKVKVAIAVVSQ